MKTLPDLLRDADPIGYEPRRSALERRTKRQAVLDAPSVGDESPQRPVSIVVVVALTLIVIAAGVYWLRSTVDAAAVRFEVRLAEESPAADLRRAVVSGTGRRIYLHEEAVVTNSDITRAQVVQGDAGSTFSVSVEFNAQSAAKMLRATQGHIGRPLAILVDAEVVSAPVVRGPISTSAIIDGNFTSAEAERIVAGIVGR